MLTCVKEAVVETRRSMPCSCYVLCDEFSKAFLPSIAQHVGHVPHTQIQLLSHVPRNLAHKTACKGSRAILATGLCFPGTQL